MRCTQTKQELTQREASIHQKILCWLGQVRPTSYIDDRGNRIVMDRFVDRLMSYLEHVRFDFNFAAHQPFSTQAMNNPKVEHFPDVLWAVRNIVLSRAVVLAEACASSDVYRRRFMKDPCFDGTIKPFAQACRYFMEDYNKVVAKFTRLHARFERMNSQESYLSILNDMLDWRYTKENRRPPNAPWHCYPEARIHEQDVGMFADEEIVY